MATSATQDPLMPDRHHSLVLIHVSGSPAVSWLIKFDKVPKMVKLSLPGPFFFFFLTRERKETFSSSHCSF